MRRMGGGGGGDIEVKEGHIHGGGGEVSGVLASVESQGGGGLK